jgi:hypothetical protein
MRQSVNQSQHSLKHGSAYSLNQSAMVALTNSVNHDNTHSLTHSSIAVFDQSITAVRYSLPVVQVPESLPFASSCDPILE